MANPRPTRFTVYLPSQDMQVESDSLSEIVELLQAELKTIEELTVKEVQDKVKLASTEKGVTQSLEAWCESIDVVKDQLRKVLKVRAGALPEFLFPPICS